MVGVIMEKRCFNCMELLEDGVCPNCKQKADSNTEEVILKERYQKGAIFSKTLDSTVFVAYDNALNKKVLIREFTGEGIAKLVNNYTAEALCQRFLNYAKTTATISLCDILPRTVDTFAEKGASYWVTDYFDGKSLKDLLSTGMKISASNALKIATSLLKGLKSIHNSKVIFGNISPDTVYILKNGEVRLFGIGSAFYDFADDIDHRVELLNPSYAAPEMFDKTAKIGTYSDVYSVAAILYRILTDKIPAISFLRSGGENLVSPHKLNKNIPSNINVALLNALNWQRENRTHTPDGFLKEISSQKVKRKLSGGIVWANFLGFFQGIYDKSAFSNKPKKSDKKEAANSEQTEKGNQKIPFLWLWITIPAVILVGLAVLLIFIFLPTSNGDNASLSSNESEETWYYGNGVETPNNSSNYVYGGTSSKRQTTSTSSQNQSNVSENSNLVECPDLVWFSLNQAKSVLESSSLLLGDVTYEYSNDFPAEFVMRQSFKSGGMIPKGSRIEIVVSKGPDFKAVVGMEMSKAIQKLNSMGYTKVTCVFSPSDTDLGVVTNADLSNNSNKITLTVSGEEATVENYCDKNVSDLAQNTTDFKFVFKTQEGEELNTSEGYENYVVVSQDIAEGTITYKGATLTLTVSTNDQ